MNVKQLPSPPDSAPYPNNPLAHPKAADICAILKRRSHVEAELNCQLAGNLPTGLA